MTRQVLVLNGPNLGRLGSREPDVYGATSYAGLVETCQALGKELGFDVDVRETNDEGEMIRWLHEAADGSVRSFSTPVPSRTTRTGCATPPPSGPPR